MTRRLRTGDVLKLTDGLFRVTRVSDCSATIVPKAKIRRAFTDARTGKQIAFEATGRAAIIAPNVDDSLLAMEAQQ